MKSKSIWTLISITLTIGLALAACSPAAPSAAPQVPTAPPATSAPAAPAATEAPAASPQAETPLAPPLITPPAAPPSGEPTPFPTPVFFSIDSYTQQLKWADAKPSGDANTPWLQIVNSDGPTVDTVQWMKTDGTVCFSNASTANSWRVSGHAAMLYEVKQQKTAGAFANFIETDAQGKPEKQIADLDSLAAKNCDVYIISPVTTELLTPAVNKLAGSGKPVVVFDRGINGTSYTTYIHPIGGYAFGYTGANFLVDALGGKGNVLALRELPGVDLLEPRWTAAYTTFAKNPDIKIVGMEFDEGDPAKAKAIVLDYLQRYDGKIDGVWSDFGGVGQAVYDAFVDYGVPVPPMTGEDFNGFLKTWDSKAFKAIAPTNPAFQWRTAVIAAAKILKGEAVPKEWVLPQPSITADTLKQFVYPDLSDAPYTMSGLNHDQLKAVFRNNP